MKTKFRFLGIAALAVLPLIMFNCTGSGSNTVERGHDPWVFRSVLDEKPRMVTLALSDTFWVAYDALHCTLYRAWRDGVNFDGAVYTTRHGPQPTSMGDAYLESSLQEGWKVDLNGEEVIPEARYKGHRFKDGHAQLSYELFLPTGETIMVMEQPEYATSESGRPILERTFMLKDVPAGATVKVAIDVSSVSSESSLKANGGSLKIDEKTPVDDPVLKAFNLKGYLSLNGNGPTVLTTRFLPNLLVPKPVVEGEDEVLPPGLALIEGSDCETCHNETKQTVGPSYLAIAKKYPTSARTVKMLAEKVMAGGMGVWGQVPMTAHPDLDAPDAEEMVKYILALDTDEAGSAGGWKDAPSYTLKSGSEPSEDGSEKQGLVVNIYQTGDAISDMPEITENSRPAFSGVLPGVHFLSTSAFKPFSEHFAMVAKGFIKIPKTTKYDFRLISDDGSFLYIDDKLVIDNGGLHGEIAMDAELNLDEGLHSIRVEFFQGGGGANCVLLWMPHDAEDFDLIPPENFSYNETDIKEVAPLEELKGAEIPGDTYPVAGVHPSFDLTDLRPEGFEPKVGGLDFLPDGRLVVTEWRSEGNIYLVDGVVEANPDNASGLSYKRIATGLAEPLGVKVVDGEIYVLQKQELTHLVDNNGDDIIDEYRTLCAGWKVSANFHEFAFGLVYQDGYFYATLATAIMPGGASASPQIPDRGKVVKISKEDGSFEFIATGLRTPNGIGFGVDNEMYVADNQGDWLPASKIVHIKEGAWYGSRSVDPEGTATMTETKPVVWLPQDEIGNSPSQPAVLNEGPYQNQMIHGEVTHGGLKRVFAEKVDGAYQGAVFRFTQGLEAGVNRVVWGPDGALYIGGVGNPGNWQHYGTNWFGLQKLKFNGLSTFEMLAVRAKSDGMEIEFTEPLAPGYGLLPSDYDIQQWYYLPTENYGGPKLDHEDLTVKSVHVSEDRKKVFLELGGMKEDHVVYVRLGGSFVSEENHALWSTEAWYTLNKIPQDNSGTRVSQTYGNLDNQLTPAEEAAGWSLLFDGKTTNGWRNYKQQTIGSDWKVVNGMLTLSGPHNAEGKFMNGGNIITDQPYENFELRLDWKISKNGNSGLIYNVQEIDDVPEADPWKTGPEMQILDNDGHPDGRIRKHRSGDLYDLIETSIVTVRPPGEWNQVRLINNNGKIEHWLNGYKVVAYEMGSEEWNELVAASKFAQEPHFGKTPNGGHICLQDHDNEVWFKNIKIRSLKPGT